MPRVIASDRPDPQTHLLEAVPVLAVAGSDGHGAQQAEAHRSSPHCMMSGRSADIEANRDSAAAGARSCGGSSALSCCHDCVYEIQCGSGRLHGNFEVFRR